MKRPSVQRSVRLDPAAFDKLTQAAATQGRSLADVIRLAVDQYISGTTRLTDSEYRHHQISEFTQIAVDSIMRKDHPELIDPVLVETRRRMETIHGKR